LYHDLPIIIKLQSKKASRLGLAYLLKPSKFGVVLAIDKWL
jgi:hypothetical protein